ncbi:hypothetical protein T01_16225 [Trichinella spiralis]|uniref:Zonadhesin n=1 Tax=Trichinella spiralis TaxID=6334 RepID=A0A0V1B8A3_TRISP|nr:hypothetical protein T01_16225 [Trichinella spiralis]
MLLTAILVVIVLALIYHFVTKKRQTVEWKETRVHPMTAIPEKKTPEEIIKESKELQLKADKKQVGKTKKKTKSKKSKKAIKSIPKGTDISKEKTETDKKIEMAESSPETIPAVTETRDVIPQILSNVGTEEITKAAEKIRREDSEKKKRKLKRKSKSKKDREMEKEMSVKQHMMSKEKSETKLRTQVPPFQLQSIAQFTEEENIMGQVVAQRDFKQQTKVEEKIKKADSKKRKSKSAKRSKSTKTKKEKTEMMVEKDISSKKHKSKLEDEIMQWTPEVRAQATESNQAEPKVEKKDSKKIKKKSKKRSKSKKIKKTVADTVAKQAASSQMPETDTTSPKLTLASEVTAIDVDQPNIVPSISEEKGEKSVIKDERKGEKKDSKKIKKRSKKRSKSKKSKKIVDDAFAKEATYSQMPETDTLSPKLTLASEVTAIDVDQPNIVPSISEEKGEKPVIGAEPKGGKKDSKKIKKKSKKRSKSKKTKKTEKDTAAKEAASSQMPETDITSPKLALASEVTAIDVDQPNIVPPISEEKVQKAVIEAEPKVEKKDSKKIKKKSKKRSKSKKSSKPVEDKVAK